MYKKKDTNYLLDVRTKEGIRDIANEVPFIKLVFADFYLKIGCKVLVTLLWANLL